MLKKRSTKLLCLLIAFLWTTIVIGSSYAYFIDSIVGNMTASAGRQINITGTLNQYNWLSQADCSNIKASGVDSIFNSVFTEDKYASLRYTDNGTTYVNTGILSLCSDFGASAVTGVPSN